MTETPRAGDYVRLRHDHASRYAGRAGLLVEVDGVGGHVRFSAKRVHTFPLEDLRRITRGVRR